MLRRSATAVLLLVICGCGGSPGGGRAGDGPFGTPVPAPLLATFQGRWVFDADRTVAAWQAQGLTTEQIENARRFGLGHEPLEITGNVAVGSGLPETEYYFFALHRCGEAVCGKAWHHEDRHDPGDMSKCHVKLRRVGDEFHFDLFMQEESVEPDDPDLTGSPAVEDPSGGADAPPDEGPDRGGWTTYVFVRPERSS